MMQRHRVECWEKKRFKHKPEDPAVFITHTHTQDMDDTGTCVSVLSTHHHRVCALQQTLSYTPLKNQRSKANPKPVLTFVDRKITERKRKSEKEEEERHRNDEGRDGRRTGSTHVVEGLEEESSVSFLRVFCKCVTTLRITHRQTVSEWMDICSQREASDWLQESFPTGPGTQGGPWEVLSFQKNLHFTVQWWVWGTRIKKVSSRDLHQVQLSHMIQ